MSETPGQNFTPEGQGFKTAGMCLVKTWGWCLGSWEPPQGNSVRTTAFPQPKTTNLKTNLSDPHALRIIWERMLSNPGTICPIWVNQREGKKDTFLPPLSRSLTGQNNKGNPKLASPKAKAYKVRISKLLVLVDFRKDIQARVAPMRH